MEDNHHNDKETDKHDDDKPISPIRTMTNNGVETVTTSQTSCSVSMSSEVLSAPTQEEKPVTQRHTIVERHTGSDPHETIMATTDMAQLSTSSTATTKTKDVLPTALDDADSLTQEATRIVVVGNPPRKEDMMGEESSSSPRSISEWRDSPEKDRVIVDVGTTNTEIANCHEEIMSTEVSHAKEDTVEAILLDLASSEETQLSQASEPRTDLLLDNSNNKISSTEVPPSVLEMPLDKGFDVKVDRPVSDELSVVEKQSSVLPTEQEEDDTNEETGEMSVIASMDGEGLEMEFSPLNANDGGSPPHFTWVEKSFLSHDNNKNNVSVPATAPSSTNTAVNEKGTEEKEENTSCAPMITEEKEDPSTHHNKTASECSESHSKVLCLDDDRYLDRYLVHLSLLDLEDDDIDEDDVARNNGNNNLSVSKVEEMGAAMTNVQDELLDQQPASVTTKGNDELLSDYSPPELQTLRSFSTLEWGDPIT
eukprot:scaffold31898_cov47-Attheya_sp.AAC.3